MKPIAVFIGAGYYFIKNIPHVSVNEFSSDWINKKVLFLVNLE